MSWIVGLRDKLYLVVVDGVPPRLRVRVGRRLGLRRGEVVGHGRRRREDVTVLLLVEVVEVALVTLASVAVVVHRGGGVGPQRSLGGNSIKILPK